MFVSVVVVVYILSEQKRREDRGSDFTGSREGKRNGSS